MKKKSKRQTTIRLESEQYFRLRKLSTKNGRPMVEYIRQGIDRILDEQRTVEWEMIKFDETAKPIGEVIEEIMADVPAEEFEKLPKDGASEHDHYISGTAKKGSNAD